MASEFHIRSERPEDIHATDRLTNDAFKTVPYSSGTEALLVRELRKTGDLALSLVADNDGEIIDHVAFSKMGAGDQLDGWFGLGPISVRSDLKHQGVSKTLVRVGVA